MTVGCGDNAREIFEESVRPLDESLASKLDVSKIPSVSGSFEILQSCVQIFLDDFLVTVLLDLICLMPFMFVVAGVFGYNHLCWRERSRGNRAINGHNVACYPSQIRFQCRHLFPVYFVLFADQPLLVGLSRRCNMFLIIFVLCSALTL